MTACPLRPDFGESEGPASERRVVGIDLLTYPEEGSVAPRCRPTLSVGKNGGWREDDMSRWKCVAASRGAALQGAFGAASVALALATGPSASADDKAPIRIGVIAEAQAVAGSSIPQAAQIAADEINAKGGVDGRRIEIVSYDNHSSSAESVRAFQRAVNEDHVNAVIGSYISEVVLALEPWSGRLLSSRTTTDKPTSRAFLCSRSRRNNCCCELTALTLAIRPSPILKAS